MDPVKSLIQMVHERRAIWDKYCDEYRDKSAKDRAWVEIYRKMEPSYDTLKYMMKNQIGTQITKKWYNVRDSYRKSLKHSHGLKRPRPYIYADLLSFLDNVNDASVTEQNETDDDAPDQPLNPIFVTTDEAYDDNGGANISKEDDDKETDDADVEVKTNDHVVSLLASIIQKEEDEDRSFFKSITPLVKKLSLESKLEFRIQVMMMLKKMTTKENAGMRLKSESFTVGGS